MGESPVAGRGKWVAAAVKQRVGHGGFVAAFGAIWVAAGKTGWVGRDASVGSRQWRRRVWGLLHVVPGGWVAAVRKWVGAMVRDGAAAFIHHPQSKVPNKSCRHAGLQVTFPAALLA